MGKVKPTRPLVAEIYSDWGNIQIEFYKNMSIA